VWHARPKLLGNDWQTPLLQACKRFLGRPYGFFDNPDFGDHNRFYCSEFVVRAYREVLPTYADTLCDRQTWSGMLKYLGASRQTDQISVTCCSASRAGTV
jgi:cell wall-associated NlpC family hydrolase